MAAVVTAQEKEALKDMTVEVKNGILHAQFPLNLKSPQPSKTGKTKILFTSHSFRWYGNVGISANIVTR